MVAAWGGEAMGGFLSLEMTNVIAQRVSPFKKKGLSGEK